MEEIIEGVRKRYIDQVLADNPELFKGAEDIHWRDHILMQACLQKHVDSSISKTINMPADTTVEEVKEAYELAWKSGLKGVTIYRDGSRGFAVLSNEAAGVGEPSGGSYEGSGATGQDARCTKAPTQDQLHATRYRVKVKKETVYVIVSENEGGRPMEIFCKFPYAQDNDWDSLCRSISLALRYGIPISDVVSQLEKSVRVLNDTPSHLARILKGYLGEDSLKCAECGGQIIFESGCEKCVECGWSKCG